MRWTLIVMLALGATATAQGASKAIKQSWAKPGVTFDEYRTDAIECAKQGYYLDISQTEDAKAFVRGSRELDAATESTTNGGPGADPLSGASADAAVDAAVRTAKQQELIRSSIQPERRIDHLKTVLQGATDECLRKRGYTLVRLSDEQQRHLRKLAIGSTERRTYLHAIATDPESLKNAVN